MQKYELTTHGFQAILNGFKFMRDHFKKLFKITLWTGGVGAVIGLVIGIVIHLGWGVPLDHLLLGTGATTSFLEVALLVQFPALLIYMKQVLETGKDVETKSIWKPTAQRILPMLGTYILTLVLVTIPFLPILKNLILTFKTQDVAAYLEPVLGYVPFLIILTLIIGLILSFSVFITITEGDDPIKSITKSASWVFEKPWRFIKSAFGAFFATLLFVLGIIILNAILFFVFGFISPFFGSGAVFFLWLAINAVALLNAVVLTPLGCMFYFSWRYRDMQVNGDTEEDTKAVEKDPENKEKEEEQSDSEEKEA